MSRRLAAIAWSAAIAAAVLLPAAPRPAGAQQTLVLPESRATVVALAVDLAAGGVRDPAPEAGVSRLAAEAILEGLRPRLAARGAVARLECDAAGLRLSLLAPPSTWQESASLFLEGLFHPEIAAEAFDSAQRRLLRSLRFQEGDPAAEIRSAAHEALFGPEHPWAHGPCGRVETLDSLPLGSARAAAQRFSPERATAALTGPFAPAEGSAFLARVFGDGRLPILLPLPQPPPLPGSRDVQSPTVTVWVAIAYPLPAQPDDEATRLLAYRIAQAVRPSPDRPHVVDAAAQVERFGGGGALVVYVAADPVAGRDWVPRVLDLVDGAGSATLDAPAFGLLLRRYRGQRLLGLAAPEALAGDAADRLFFDHAYAAPEARVDALTPERLRAAAAALGPPAVAYLGPNPGDSATRARSLDRHTGHE